MADRKKSNLKLADAKPFEKSRNPLTSEEGGRLGEALAWSLANGDAEDVARLLLLCRALAYEGDATERENMLIAVEERAGILPPSFDRALEGDVRRQLAKLREGRVTI